MCSPTAVVGASLLVHLDELQLLKGASAEEFKSLITEDCITLEQKFKDQVHAKSFSNFIWTVNTAPELTAQQRRFCLINVNSSKANDQEFYGPLWDMAQDPAFSRLFYRYLINLDLEGFNAHRFPCTRETLAAEVVTRPPEAEFVQHLILGCGFKPLHHPFQRLYEESAATVAIKLLHESYIDYMRTHFSMSAKPVSMVMFKSALEKVLGVELAISTTRIDGKSYRAYWMPALSSLRNRLESMHWWHPDQFVERS
jgi:hypothetical protein